MNSVTDDPKSNSFQSDDYYSIIGHPHRRKLLEFLHNSTIGTIKNFQEELNIRTGTLYHHLSFLKKKKLITQNSARGYILTDTGREIAREFLLFPSESNNNVDDLTNIVSAKNKVDDLLSTIIKPFDNILNYSFSHKLAVAFISIISAAIILLFLSGLHLGIFIYQHDEPLTVELFISVGLLYVPISIGLFITMILLQFPIFNQFLYVTIILIELLSQIYWIILIYLLFRKIHGLEEKKSLIGSLIINYAFLLPNLLLK